MAVGDPAWNPIAKASAEPVRRFQSQPDEMVKETLLSMLPQLVE